jgi:integrase
MLRSQRGDGFRHPQAEKARARLRMPADPEALVTTGERLDRWLEQRSGPRASTIRGYAAHVRLYLRPCLGHILLADLTAQHVHGMFTAIARQREAAGQPVAVWTSAQTARFLNAIRGHQLYGAYHLIALRGLRRCEAAGLRWCDIDLGTATAIILSCSASRRTSGPGNSASYQVSKT